MLTIIKSVSSTLRLDSVLLRLRLVIFLTAFTVTSQVAILPLLVCTVIVAVPIPTAVSRPFSSTLTELLFELVQISSG